MTFDARMQSTALRLITLRGRTIGYTRQTTGAYNPATGTATTTSSTVYIKAVVTNVGGADLSTGTLVERNSRMLLIAATAMALPPTVGDGVIIDGDLYMVQSSDVSYAGELPATYKMLVGKA
jgi:hypothetical protein